MLKHFIKITFRNLAKQKGLATINILGLSIGLACFCLFLLYAVNEFNYDRFHTKGDDIYRVYRWRETLGERPPGGDSYLPMPLGPAIKNDLADVENSVRMQDGWAANFIKVNGNMDRMEIKFADPEFFDVFSFKLKYGNPKTALSQLKSLVLSEETADKLFGKENPIGKTVEAKIGDEFEPFIVSGVAENIPSNSSIRFNILANFQYLYTSKYGKKNVDSWRSSSYQTYVKLKTGSKLASQPDRLLAFRKKYYPDEEEELRKRGDWKGIGAPVKYRLQPLLSMHTDTRISGPIEPVEAKNIWILVSIAAGVLLIACINFTTLAIGRSAGRAKEVGVRKVIGSRKKDLVSQFLMEALFLSLFSMVIGLLLAKLLLPFFNELSGTDLKFSFIQFPELIWLIVGLVLVVGLLAGSYPALILSRFNPIEVLKSKLRLGGSNFFTKSLVTLQFILSAGLIISTVIILQQLKYMRSKNPGFNKENVVVVDADGTKSKKLYPLFKQALASHPEISGIAGSELGLGEGTGWSKQGFDYQGQHKEVFEYFIDNDYIDLMKIELLRGRNFDAKIASDTINSVIINEAMVNDFGWTLDNAVGQQLIGYSENLTPVVVGVVKNFNFLPLREDVDPQLFHQFADYAPYKYFVRIKAGDPSKAIAAMNTEWKKVVPDLPFRYTFLDENINRFYKGEERWGNIIGWAGGVSIFLASLGLLGLAALAAINRTKEIGIRKVLGASVSSIVGLLSKDFLKLVIIALVIAAPVAWYFMNEWLQDFAYRINISAWVFIITSIAAVSVALLTVSIQAIKTAIKNPVKSLRTE
jgi:putative ABC transport system permease protein